MTDDEQLAWVDDLRGRRVKPTPKAKTVKSRVVKKAVVESDGDDGTTEEVSQNSVDS